MFKRISGMPDYAKKLDEYKKLCDEIASFPKDPRFDNVRLVRILLDICMDIKFMREEQYAFNKGRK